MNTLNYIMYSGNQNRREKESKWSDSRFEAEGQKTGQWGGGGGGEWRGIWQANQHPGHIYQHTVIPSPAPKGPVL